MIKTKEMFDSTHKRNSQDDWNIEDDGDSTIGNWINQDSVGASYALGEDVLSAVVEVLGYEQ